MTIDPEELKLLLKVNDGPLKNVEDVILPEPLASNKRRQTGPRRGPKSLDEWLAEIRRIWGYLRDIDELSKSWIASLQAVQDLAASRYGGRTIGQGLALQELLKKALVEVQQYDMEDKTREILKRFPDMKMREIAFQLDIDRSQMSRNYTRKAVSLLTKAFQRIIDRTDSSPSKNQSN